MWKIEFSASTFKPFIEKVIGCCTFESMIYHIATLMDLEQGKQKGEYLPASYDREAFIHASALPQLKGVVERYYAGVGDLYVLEIDELKLKSLVKYEASTGGELYPHIFGPIQMTAVKKITPLELFMNPNQKGNQH